MDRMVEADLEDQYDDIELAILANLLESSDSDDNNSSSEDEDDELTVLALLADDIVTQLEEINEPRLCQTDPIDNTEITLASLTDEFIQSRMKFTRDEVTQLMDEMRVPEYFILNAHQPGKEYNFSGEHAFLFTLARMASCQESLWNQQNEWHADLSVLSKAFAACVSWMDSTHSHRLRRLAQYQPAFAVHNAALITTMQNTDPGEVPAEANDIAMFLDTTRITVSRPQVNDVAL